MSADWPISITFWVKHGPWFYFFFILMAQLLYIWEFQISESFKFTCMLSPFVHHQNPVFATRGRLLYYWLGNRSRLAPWVVLKYLLSRSMALIALLNWLTRILKNSFSTETFYSQWKHEYVTIYKYTTVDWIQRLVLEFIEKISLSTFHQA